MGNHLVNVHVVSSRNVKRGAGVEDLGKSQIVGSVAGGVEKEMSVCGGLLDSSSEQIVSCLPSLVEVRPFLQPPAECRQLAVCAGARGLVNNPGTSEGSGREIEASSKLLLDRVLVVVVVTVARAIASGVANSLRPGLPGEQGRSLSDSRHGGGCRRHLWDRAVGLRVELGS